jgi:hypothetical protein
LVEKITALFSRSGRGRASLRACRKEFGCGLVGRTFECWATLPSGLNHCSFMLGRPALSRLPFAHLLPFLKRTGGWISLLLLLFSGVRIPAVGQSSAPRVVTSDIDRFWLAYDSVRTTTDSLRQITHLQRLYIDPGSAGLRALMATKGYTAPEWVGAIRRYPRFWNSIRPRTQLVKAGVPGLEPYLDKLKALYPALRPATIYLTVGCLRTGGTTQGNAVLIGVELATGNAGVDISEFPPAMRGFLARSFARDPLRDLLQVCVHEYVHTQEKRYGNNVLGQAIYEGTCDFVAEKVMNRPNALPYLKYGSMHEAILKERFKAEMFQPRFNRWFYNQESNDPTHVPDLGYYMGYAICRAYYQQAANKRQAVQEMIELDYTSDQAVEAFLTRSRYFPAESVPRLRAAYEERRPAVTGIRPLPAVAQPVSPSLQEITITFSQPMSPNTSIDYGPGGKATWPLTGPGTFATDHQSVTYKVSLLPEREYEFLINGGGFRSMDGYPLKPYFVKFKTSK